MKLMNEMYKLFTRKYKFLSGSMCPVRSSFLTTISHSPMSVESDNNVRVCAMLHTHVLSPLHNSLSVNLTLR